MVRWLVAILFVTLICGPLSAFEIVPGVVGNDQVLKARLGFGDPNMGIIGLEGSWNEQDSTRLYGLSAFGQYDISGHLADGLTAIFGVPQSWWEALGALGARAYLGAEVGSVNISRTPEAQSTLYLGAAVGPIVLEVGESVIEGGKILAGDGLLDESGLVWFIGVARVFRF